MAYLTSQVLEIRLIYVSSSQCHWIDSPPSAIKYFTGQPRCFSITHAKECRIMEEFGYLLLSLGLPSGALADPGDDSYYYYSCSLAAAVSQLGHNKLGKFLIGLPLRVTLRIVERGKSRGWEGRRWSGSSCRCTGRVNRATNVLFPISVQDVKEPVVWVMLPR